MQLEAELLRKLLPVPLAHARLAQRGDERHARPEGLDLLPNRLCDGEAVGDVLEELVCLERVAERLRQVLLHLLRLEVLERVRQPSVVPARVRPRGSDGRHAHALVRACARACAGR